MGATFRKKGIDQPGQAGQPGQYGDKAVPPGLLFVQAAKELCEAAASMQENPVISAFIGATYASLKDMALQAYPEAAAQIQWQDGVGTVADGAEDGLVDDQQNDPNAAAADPNAAAAAPEDGEDDFDLSSMNDNEDSDPFAVGEGEDEDEDSEMMEGEDEDEDSEMMEDEDEDEDSEMMEDEDEGEDEDSEMMEDEDEDAYVDDEDPLDGMDDENALSDEDEAEDEDEEMMEDEDEDGEMMEDEDEDEEEEAPPPKAKGKGKSPFPDFGAMGAKKKKALGNLDKILEDTTSSVSSLSDSVGDLVDRIKKMTGRVD